MTGMHAAQSVQADFDQIALLSSDGFDHNTFYHDFLLRSLETRINEALDIGCGTGQFTRLLARRAVHVVGLDLSPNMIAVARQRSATFENIEFRQVDVVSWDWPVEQFDAIVSIATL